MKALLVLPSPPLAFGGAASRWFHALLTGLRERGVQVTAFVCNGSAQDNSDAMRVHGASADLRIYASPPAGLRKRLGSLLRPNSHSLTRRMEMDFQREARKSYDHIVFETHFTGWLTRRIPAGARINVHFLAAIDAQAFPKGRFLANLKLQNLLRGERAVLRRFKSLTALTPRLVSAVRQINPTAKVGLTPLTIDVRNYELTPRPVECHRRPSIGLIGSFEWGPTKSAADALMDRVWPRVKAEVPDCRLLLVGRNADNYVSQLPHKYDYEVHSDVPDSIPFFRELDALVYLPKVGSGMKVKVLEAIALGTPVYTNADGAEGLPEGAAQVIAYGELDALVTSLTRQLSGQRPLVSVEELRERTFGPLSIDRCVEAYLAASR
jgi:glycosyltransferase involved in cell wall biosynthesis